MYPAQDWMLGLKIKAKTPHSQRTHTLSEASDTQRQLQFPVTRTMTEPCGSAGAEHITLTGNGEGCGQGKFPGGGNA